MRSQHRPAVYAILAAAIGALVLGLIVAIVQTRDLAGAIRETQQANTTTVDLIRNCTQPGGKCYERGQKQTGRAIADINLVTIYAASCGARHPGDPEMVRECVTRLLAKEK